MSAMSRVPLISVSSSPIRWRRKSLIIYSIVSSLIILLGWTLGLIDHIYELDFATQFTYPVDVENFPSFVDRFVEARTTDGDEKAISEFKPFILNRIDFYGWKIKNANKCLPVSTSNPTNLEDEDTQRPATSIRLLILIKSAVPYKTNRDAIRKTWGSESRFSDVSVKRVFLLGTCSPDTNHDYDSCSEDIVKESNEYGDLIQGDFVDSYYNNTIKTLLGFQWIFQNCVSAEYILVVDDDFYVSQKNLLKYIHKLENGRMVGGIISENIHQFYGAGLYAGYVFNSSRPMRHRIGPGSKWHISLNAYPYNRFPPYVAGGATLFDRTTIARFAAAVFLTRSFPFDDIYISILAHKLAVLPRHSSDFYFWSRPPNMSNVIASHGFRDPIDLLRMYEVQKRLGFA